MRSTFQSYEPPYYDVTVEFKPVGVASYNASELRDVEFRVDSELSRGEYYEIAREEVVKQGVISVHGLEYWEAFRVSLDCPSPPSGIVFR